MLQILLHPLHRVSRLLTVCSVLGRCFLSYSKLCSPLVNVCLLAGLSVSLPVCLYVCLVTGCLLSYDIFLLFNLFVHVSLSVNLSVCLSFCQKIDLLTVHLSVSMSYCLPIHPSSWLPGFSACRQSASRYVRFCLSVCLSVCWRIDLLTVHLSVSMSFCLPIHPTSWLPGFSSACESAGRYVRSCLSVCLLED